MTTEQKLPEWWDEFCNAVKTRTLDEYECQYLEWEATRLWNYAQSCVENLYESPHSWRFRKRARTININGVELVAPMLAGEVVPKNTVVWAFYGCYSADDLSACTMVFTSEKDRDAMRAALLWVKP